MGCGVKFTGWGVNVLDGVLVNGMVCYFPEWGVTFRNGVLVLGMGC